MRIRQNTLEKVHNFSDARIRENLSRTSAYFLGRLFGRKTNKKSKCDRRSTLKDDSHFSHSKGPHVSVLVLSRLCLGPDIWEDISGGAVVL